MKNIIFIILYVLLLCTCNLKQTQLMCNRHISDYHFDSYEEAALPIGSSIEIGHLVKYRQITFFIITDQNDYIKYIRTWSDNFQSPEKYSAKVKWSEIQKKDIVNIYPLFSVNKTVVVLKSGWKLLFDGLENHETQVSICIYLGNDL